MSATIYGIPRDPDAAALLGHDVFSVAEWRARVERLGGEDNARTPWAFSPAQWAERIERLESECRRGRWTA